MKSKKIEAFRYAFLQTIPVLCGYLFLGMAFGILLENAGYGVSWALLISLVVYAGSMQFVMVTFLTGGTNLLTVALMTLSINSRHMFYGLSFVEAFKKMGKKGLYMIFSLTDETYSVLCGTKVQKGMNEEEVQFYMAILNHSYWIVGSIIGAFIGNKIPFDTTGIDFAMTALFVVIFIEQWLGSKSHLPAVIGISCAVISLLLFGKDRFMLPALIGAVISLMMVEKRIMRKEGKADAN